jgi:hypothetical protein
VPATLAETSQDFGLIHWNAAAPTKPTGFSPGRRVAATRRGDSPGQPEQKGGADPVERPHHRGIGEHDAAQPERDDEHHHAHADGDPEQAR